MKLPVSVASQCHSCESPMWCKIISPGLKPSAFAPSAAGSLAKTDRETKQRRIDKSHYDKNLNQPPNFSVRARLDKECSAEEMEGAGNVDTSLVADALNLNIGTQEDAQEFLLRLLDEIDCSTDSDNGTDQVQPISNSFRGATEQTIKCTNIDFSKTRQQRFLDLTVDIMGHDNLGKALQDMFTKPDYLKGIVSSSL